MDVRTVAWSAVADFRVLAIFLQLKDFVQRSFSADSAGFSGPGMPIFQSSLAWTMLSALAAVSKI